LIRRGFWLATGAVLGVAGYRRATRLARMLSAPRPATMAPPGPRTRALPSRSQAAAGVLRSGASHAVAAAGFVRDVRDGMAEYRDLHRGAPDSGPESRNLEGTGDRTSSGGWQQDRSEP
jgi:hypothetical protein